MKATVPPPLHVAWEITRRCNALCQHCSSASGPDAGDPEPGEFTTEECFRVMDQLSEAGVQILAFTGGEPLTRRDLPRLLEYARGGGMGVHICTNGSFLDAEKARELWDAGLRSITVSLDGGRAQTHDRLRGSPGLFEAAVQAIRRLVDHGYRVSVSFTPTTENRGEAEEVIQLACQLGAASVCVSQYIPTGRGTRELMLSPGELHQLVNQVLRLRTDYGRSLTIHSHDCHVALLLPESERETYRGCAAGFATAALKANGTVTPCIFMSTELGNLRRQPFAQVWNEAPGLQEIRDRDRLTQGNCGACRFKLVCGGCRAAALAIHGDPLAGDPTCWMFPDDRANAA